ncbi:hypothetical protein Gotur_010491 [Gossypium turneri]
MFGITKSVDEVVTFIHGYEKEAPPPPSLVKVNVDAGYSISNQKAILSIIRFFMVSNLLKNKDCYTKITVKIGLFENSVGYLGCESIISKLLSNGGKGFEKHGGPVLG